MSDSPTAGGKSVYACSQCGYSFYQEVCDPGTPPEASVPCPQCGAPDAGLTFVLAARCESADC